MDVRPALRCPPLACGVPTPPPEAWLGVLPFHVDGPVLEPQAAWHREGSAQEEEPVSSHQSCSAPTGGGCCKEESQPPQFWGQDRQASAQGSLMVSPADSQPFGPQVPRAELSLLPFQWPPESLGFPLPGKWACRGALASLCRRGPGHRADPASTDLRTHLPAGHSSCDSTPQI